MVVVAFLFLGSAGQAVASEQLPRCSAADAITNPKIYAPKKVAAGRQFKLRYALNVEGRGDISAVFLRFLNKKGKTKHLFKPYFNQGYIRPTVEQRDGKSRFRLEWVQTTKDGSGDEVSCRNSFEKKVTPWRGHGAKFRIRYPSGGEVVWKVTNGQQLCSSEGRRLQTTTDYYQLRIRGANGNLRSTVTDICDWSEKTFGNRSGKWELYYWSSGRNWHFYPVASNLPEGLYNFRWALYREKKVIRQGRFGIRVRFGY